MRLGSQKRAKQGGWNSKAPIDEQPCWMATSPARRTAAVHSDRPRTPLTITTTRRSRPEDGSEAVGGHGRADEKKGGVCGWQRADDRPLAASPTPMPDASVCPAAETRPSEVATTYMYAFSAMRCVARARPASTAAMTRRPSTFWRRGATGTAACLSLLAGPRGSSHAAVIVVQVQGRIPACLSSLSTPRPV